MFTKLPLKFVFLTFSLIFSLESFAIEKVAPGTHIPMYFRPDFNGVKVAAPHFSYDFSDLRDLKLGSQRFAFRDFKIKFIPLALSFSASSTYKYAYVMAFSWPKRFIKKGRIRLENIREEVIFEGEISLETSARWFAMQKSIASGKPPEGVDWNVKSVRLRKKDTLFEERWGTVIFEKWKANDFRKPFRFCVSDEGKGSYSLVCSPYFSLRKGIKTDLWKWKRKSLDGVRVIANRKIVHVKSVFEQDTESLLFKAFFDNGMHIEFSREFPRDIVIEEIARDDKTGIIRVTGRNKKPINSSWNLQGAPKLDFWDLLYFDRSFGKKRKYWELELSPNATAIPVALHGVDRFEFPIKYEKLPPLSAKIYLKKQKEESYDRFPRLLGYLREDVKLWAETPSEIDFHIQSGEFEWEYYASQKDAYNPGVLNVNYRGEEWKAVHDIYRGSPMEISLATSTAALQSLGLKYWFEDVFGWQNKLLSVQRWGISLSAEKSTSQGYEALSTNSGIEEILIWNAGARYRLNEGLWMRSMAYGLIFDYQYIELNSASATMLGAGAFWSGPMPRLVDSVFNIVPFFRYPKFVDMSFVMYMQSLDSNVELGTNFKFNVAAKILWSKNFFGELGAGVKSHNYTNPNSNVLLDNLDYNSFYGSVGIGWLF